MVHDVTRAAVHNKLVLLKARGPDDWDVATLLEWSNDPNAEVRDWATFTLAIGDDTSEEVRLALLARVLDTDLDTRCEALVGLARRRDQRGVQPLMIALGGEIVTTLMVEAAGYYARREFIEPLEELIPWWDVDEELLQQALSRCRGLTAPDDRYWDVLESR